MIKFALRCDGDHAFESWFRDNLSYDELVQSGHLTCPECGSVRVTKALMAPAIVTGRRRGGREPDAPKPAAPSDAAETAAALQPVAVADERAAALRAALREMRDHLVRHSKDVGPQFADEARRIHEGQSDKTAIHGQASQDEVRSLIEDGIEVMPLPVFPDERN